MTKKNNTQVFRDRKNGGKKYQTVCFAKSHRIVVYRELHCYLVQNRIHLQNIVYPHVLCRIFACDNAMCRLCLTFNIIKSSSMAFVCSVT